MKKQYDFSKGVKGKYYKRFVEGNNIAIIEPEVSKVFPDSKSVNEALKELIKLSRIVKRKLPSR